MTSLRAWSLAALSCAVILSGCDCGGTVVIPGDGGVDSGYIPPSTGNDGGGGDGGELDAGHDAGPMVDPGNPNNATIDSDCDGLSDAEEFANVYAGMKKTHPGNPDSDGDGIPDGVELGRTQSVDAMCGFVGDANPDSKTIPTEADSDSDGVSDGLEDANHNGAIDPGETSPNNPDSDGDQLMDGAEDANQNGALDPGETDPRSKDSDLDGINDGVEKNITGTDPTKADTDGDTCSDGVEDGNQNGTTDPGETDPTNAMDCGAGNFPDADMDGLPNSIEDANQNGSWDPATETNFQNADTDGDGLSDGLEDKNKNGQVNAGETNPRRKDSDCDGLLDGPNSGAFKGEDLNGNGAIDMGETDPTRADSDSDGIFDGVELGNTTVADPTNCLNVPVDTHPSSTTDPNDNDSDNDGIADGAEDNNQNGQVDSGELNPNDGTDGTGPAGQVCTANNLKPVVFKEEGQPDIQLGLPSTFTELNPIMVGGAAKGLMGYDPTNQVAFLVYRTAAPGANVVADEQSIRGSLGSVTNVNTQPFTTWDGFNALQAFYDHSSTQDLKAQANALASSLAGASALVGNAGISGPFKIQAEYVHRSNQSLVVLIALAKLTDYGNTAKQTLFSISDAAGGSALAQFGDANAVQCETFQTSNALVDFLFVVDDSCSMASYQNALGSAATAMGLKLNNAIDYRLGLVTTSYYAGSGTNANVLRGFTTSVAEFKGWLTENNNCSGGMCNLSATTCSNQNQCWVTINGAASERALESARKATEALSPATANSTFKVRPNAQLVVVVLADADDQNTAVTIQTYSDYFNNAGATAGVNKNSLNQKIPVHGILCPGDTGTSGCGETQYVPRRTASVINATGGVRGDINDPGGTSIATTINTIVDSAIAAAGYKTKKPPIGASVKVAMNAVLNGANCNKNDLPRSRVNGFDVDGKAGTVSFFGDCRPAAQNTPAAVSYRYWIDTTPNANGNPPPCSNDPDYDPTEADLCDGNLACNKVLSICECPANCGGTAPPGKVCNPNKLVCDFVCTPDCGGTCTGYQTCDQNSCGCTCVQNATCAPGFTFVNNGTQCGCFCDTAQLGCGTTFDADPVTCSCVCKPSCGGCPDGTTCDASSCQCGGGIG